MRRWIFTGVILSGLAFAGCGDEASEVDLELGGTPEVEGAESEIPETAERDVPPSAGAAQHAPPEEVEVEPEEVPDERVAGAAQHPLPENVRE